MIISRCDIFLKSVKVNSSNSVESDGFTLEIISTVYSQPFESKNTDADVLGSKSGVSVISR